METINCNKNKMVVVSLREKLFILIKHQFFSKLHRIGVIEAPVVY